MYLKISLVERYPRGWRGAAGIASGHLGLFHKTLERQSPLGTYLQTGEMCHARNEMDEGLDKAVCWGGSPSAG